MGKGAFVLPERLQYKKGSRVFCPWEPFYRLLMLREMAFTTSSMTMGFDR